MSEKIHLIKFITRDALYERANQFTRNIVFSCSIPSDCWVEKTVAWMPLATSLSTPVTALLLSQSRNDPNAKCSNFFCKAINDSQSMYAFLWTKREYNKQITWSKDVALQWGERFFLKKWLFTSPEIMAGEKFKS